MQPKQQPAASLEDLTKTLDYTFIDLPELVDGSDDGEHYCSSHAEECMQSGQQAAQLQQSQQQQPQPGSGFLSLPYYQQLQQGAQQAQQAAEPALGPLGQAFLLMQQQAAPQKTLQQPHQPLGQQSWQAGGAFSTAQQPQTQQQPHPQADGQAHQEFPGGHAAGSHQMQHSAQASAQATAADMDES